MKTFLRGATLVGWIQLVLIFQLKYEVSHASTGRALNIHTRVENSNDLKTNQQPLNLNANLKKLPSNVRTKEGYLAKNVKTGQTRGEDSSTLRVKKQPLDNITLKDNKKKSTALDTKNIAKTAGSLKEENGNLNNLKKKTTSSQKSLENTTSQPNGIQSSLGILDRVFQNTGESIVHTLQDDSTNLKDSQHSLDGTKDTSSKVQSNTSTKDKASENRESSNVTLFNAAEEKTTSLSNKLNNTSSQALDLKSNSTSKDSVIESSGVLDVEFESGSSEGSTNDDSDLSAQIKLNGKRLHSISEAITKLLNSGRERLQNLKRGTFPDPHKTNGPVVRTYVSDSTYDSKPHVTHHHKHRYHRSRRQPYRYRQYGRLNDFGYLNQNEEPLINPYANSIDDTAMRYSIPKVSEYQRPYYLYYSDADPVRYNSIASPYQEQYDANMEQNLLRSYALQEELAGIQSFYSCHPNPCKHGGRCHRSGMRFKCICKKGFMGLRCHSFCNRL